MMKHAPNTTAKKKWQIKYPYFLIKSQEIKRRN